jgi:hypothetical protein
MKKLIAVFALAGMFAFAVPQGGDAPKEKGKAEKGEKGKGKGKEGKDKEKSKD